VNDPTSTKRPARALTDEEIDEAGRELCRRTRAAQGLPPHVTDPVVLDRLAVIFRPTGSAKESA
jgi:hypothetical protein